MTYLRNHETAPTSHTSERKDGKMSLFFKSSLTAFSCLPSASLSDYFSPFISVCLSLSPSPSCPLSSSHTVSLSWLTRRTIAAQSIASVPPAPLRISTKHPPRSVSFFLETNQQFAFSLFSHSGLLYMRVRNSK